MLLKNSFRATAKVAVLMPVIVNFLPLAAHAADYRLGPGDVLAVTILKHADWSLETATVPADGIIQVPAAGAINVIGKTAAQVDAEIEKKLKRRLLNPEVTVSIRQQRIRRVTVQGAVEKPASIEVQAGWRVSDAIAAAGGLRFRPELTSGLLTRAGKRPVALDVVRLLNGVDAANPVLRPDDRLNFVAKTVTVRVSGQVATPGPIQVPIGQGVLEAITLAGGATPRAALSRTSLNRGNQVIPVDLYAVLTLGKREENRPVKDGDLVIVPESSGRVSVGGAVAKPGFQDLPDGRALRLKEVLAQAGGPSPRAALTKATVTRADGTVVPVDLYNVTVQNDADANILMQSGDVISIPEARGVTVLGTTKPGTYVVEEGAAPRISEVLAQAGGLGMAPDSVKISILRTTADGKQQSLDVDAVKLIQQGDASQNARVFDGDLVNVGSTLRTVYINGVNQDGKNTVKAPGAYELRPGDGVRELLARAGGVNDNAALSKIKVQRNGKTLGVNAYAQVSGAEAPFALEPGDNVTIPALDDKVNIMPAVNKPGLVYLPENQTLTVGEVLALAGGPTNTAKIKEIALYRIGKGGALKQTLISLNPAVRKSGYADISTPVQAGDYIYVPPGDTGPSGFQKFASLLSPLTALGRLF
jgi:protein involved in polysaccharide export with SLBB domain